MMSSRFKIYSFHLIFAAHISLFFSESVCAFVLGNYSAILMNLIS